MNCIAKDKEDAMVVKAKDSKQIQKVRKKLQRQLQAAERLSNDEALDRMTLLIQEQLHRQQSVRINLKNRQIATFDENQHPEQVKSHFILKLIKKIKTEKPPSKYLKGRITPLSHKNHE